jgi:hypothetical protein
MNKVKLCMALAAATFLSGCITFPTVKSEHVKVIWHDTNAIQECHLIGPVYGSEGSFYDSWLHADKNMVWGALNQMRIQTDKLGGDVLYMFDPLGFSSSVTFLGNAYACAPEAKVKAVKITAAKIAKMEAEEKAKKADK